ncbi:MAG: 5-bromo-4-chloroindolyl phosphate hydrolysis family protein [bacterium]|nr:5-bromo-4-chloroindolyl phosphate hydrolysis family protein [bacterium]
MSQKKWNEYGEEILNSVLHAVESGDFTDLSRNVSEAVSQTVNAIGRGVDEVSREVSRQAKQTAEQIRANEAIKKQAMQHGRQSQEKYEHYRQVPVNTRCRQRSRKLPGENASVALISVGTVFTSIFGITTLVAALAFIAGGSVAWLIASGICTLPFVMMIGRGSKLSARNRRFRQYMRLAGEKGYCEITRLAKHIGKRKKYVIKDIKQMMEKGYFLEGHLDDQMTTLMVTDEAYQQYCTMQQSQLLDTKVVQRAPIDEEEQKNGYSAEVADIIQQGEAYIAHIHECNDAIPGFEMSEKLAKLEDIMRRIFAQIKVHPESADELQKFMNYYLPTTTKLVDAYRDLDGQPEYGDNITKTKKEIEGTLDTINEAFAKLFDSLFEDTAWDISSDISTMKVMLAQEGLTENKDFV